MLRALATLLLLANLVFFAWARGWLAPALPPPEQGEREPERLAAQVRPETIQLFTPQAASAAVAAGSAVCLEAGPFSDADVGVAEAALLASGVPAAAWTRQPVQQPAVWLVYLGRFAAPAALRAKADELRRLKLTFEELQAPPELTPGLVLSRNDQREAADAALAQAEQRGVRSARVVALPPPPLQHWLRAPRADAELQAKLGAIKPPLIAAAFGPCATRP
jgi:hypothetical protein